MKVYTGTFRYIHDGACETIVATTVERIERELARMMSEYVKWIDDTAGNLPTDFSALQQMGWDNEWYDVSWNCTDLLTDEHILKHVMEKI